MTDTTLITAGKPAEERLVHAELRGEVGVLTLDHDSRRNALSKALLDDLNAGLDEFSGKARAVILRARPDVKVWSAGHDIGELRSNADPLGYEDPLEYTLRAIRDFSAPVIAMVQGSVWGGAVDLVLSCDMVVADETASFAITPVNIGLPYNTTGLLHFMGRVPLNVIKEMFFTAAPVKSNDAIRWGIVNHLLATTELEAFSFNLAETIVAKAPLAVAVIKKQLKILSDYQPIAAQIFEQMEAMRREVYESADFQEGIDAFLKKRKPVFKGH